MNEFKHIHKPAVTVFNLCTRGKGQYFSPLQEDWYARLLMMSLLSLDPWEIHVRIYYTGNLYQNVYIADETLLTDYNCTSQEHAMVHLLVPLVIWLWTLNGSPRSPIHCQRRRKICWTLLMGLLTRKRPASCIFKTFLCCFSPCRSRLGCQVVVTEDLDGLKLNIPMATIDARET